MDKSNWTYKKLRDISTTICDGDWIESKDQSPEGIRLIQTGNIGSGVFKDKEDKSKFISEETFERLKCTEIFPGDVLVSRLPDPIGRSCILPKLDSRMITAVDCSIVRLSDECLPKYYVYYTQSNRYSTDIINFTTGSTRKRISRKNLESLLIPVPSKETQLNIVKEFDSINDSITLLQQQVKDIDTLAQSLFYSTFGDPITNPLSWPVKNLSEIGQIVAGSTPSTTDESNWDGDVNWVTPAELSEQLFYGETVRKLTDKGAKGLALMPIGTVLISSRAPIGKLAITTVPMCCNQGFKNIICNDSINNIYLFFFLKLTMDKVKALGRGATFKEVSKSAISSYKVVVPSFTLQKSFASNVLAIEEAKEALNKQIDEMQTLLSARMQYWFE